MAGRSCKCHGKHRNGSLFPLLFPTYTISLSVVKLIEVRSDPVSSYKIKLIYITSPKRQFPLVTESRKSVKVPIHSEIQYKAQKHRN